MRNSFHILLALLLLQATRAQAQLLKKYEHKQPDISFYYPGDWLLLPKDTAAPNRSTIAIDTTTFIAMEPDYRCSDLGCFSSVTKRDYQANSTDYREEDLMLGNEPAKAIHFSYVPDGTKETWTEVIYAFCDRKGVMQIQFYAPGEHYSKYLPEFQKIIARLSFDNILTPCNTFTLSYPSFYRVTTMGDSALVTSSILNDLKSAWSYIDMKVRQVPNAAATDRQYIDALSANLKKNRDKEREQNRKEKISTVQLGGTYTGTLLEYSYEYGKSEERVYYAVLAIAMKGRLYTISYDFVDERVIEKWKPVFLSMAAAVSLN